MRNRLVRDCSGVLIGLAWAAITTEVDVLLDVCEDYCRRTGVTPSQLMLMYPETLRRIRS